MATAKFSGQISLEALAAFAFLLAAVSIMAIAAGRYASAFSLSTSDSAAKISLSQDALALHASSWAVGHSSFNLSMASVPIEGERIASIFKPGVTEPVFCRVFLGQNGELHVQTKNIEPV
ncbi:MAG: hypothetical protein NT051_02185 [Candidatus Micrarchaeota archaeon]|nr:hypothetical protein [Candidatus Micrarchaeota archaeon]